MERLLRIASPLGLYAEEFEVERARHLGQLPAGVLPPGPDPGRGADHPGRLPGGAVAVTGVRTVARASWCSAAGWPGSPAPTSSATRASTVTLVDRNDYHQFQPLLYQVATSQLPARGHRPAAPDDLPRPPDRRGA